MLLELAVFAGCILAAASEMKDGAKNSGSFSNYVRDEHDRLEKKYQDRTSSGSKRD